MKERKMPIFSGTKGQLLKVSINWTGCQNNLIDISLSRRRDKVCLSLAFYYFLLFRTFGVWRVECNFALVFFLNTNQFIGFHMTPKYSQGYFSHFLKIYLEFSSFYFTNLPPFQLAVFLLSLMSHTHYSHNCP